MLPGQTPRPSRHARRATGLPEPGSRRSSRCVPGFSVCGWTRPTGMLARFPTCQAQTGLQPVQTQRLPADGRLSHAPVGPWTRSMPTGPAPLRLPHRGSGAGTGLRFGRQHVRTQAAVDDLSCAALGDAGTRGTGPPRRRQRRMPNAKHPVWTTSASSTASRLTTVPVADSSIPSQIVEHQSSVPIQSASVNCFSTISSSKEVSITAPCSGKLNECCTGMTTRAQGCDGVIRLMKLLSSILAESSVSKPPVPPTRIRSIIAGR